MESGLRSSRIDTYSCRACADEMRRVGLLSSAGADVLVVNVRAATMGRVSLSRVTRARNTSALPSASKSRKSAYWAPVSPRILVSARGLSIPRLMMVLSLSECTSRALHDGQWASCTLLPGLLSSSSARWFSIIASKPLP